jgi:hypothetical protein
VSVGVVIRRSSVVLLRGISRGNFTAENAEDAEKNKNNKSEILKPKQILITKEPNPKPGFPPSRE